MPVTLPIDTLIALIGHLPHKKITHKKLLTKITPQKITHPIKVPTLWSRPPSTENSLPSLDSNILARLPLPQTSYSPHSPSQPDILHETDIIPGLPFNRIFLCTFFNMLSWAITSQHGHSPYIEPTPGVNTHLS